MPTNHVPLAGGMVHVASATTHQIGAFRAHSPVWLIALREEEQGGDQDGGDGWDDKESPDHWRPHHVRQSASVSCWFDVSAEGAR